VVNKSLQANAGIVC